MADLQQTMGATLRRERRALGLTLKELAERAALSVVYLGEIERGKKYPSALVIERLAAALELTVPDLLERVAEDLRGVEQPVMAIGFALPGTAHTSRIPHGNGGRILDMLVA
ncbi:MAG TPA: helix-turn-helix transcriptional regulator [Ktedonobacterales bacterium]|nr:helix-turn-helix transcriptional regulator [Ktedonobacterales bacterium]